MILVYDLKCDQPILGCNCEHPTLDGFALTFRLLRASKNPEFSHLTLATSHEDYPEGMDVNSPFLEPHSLKKDDWG